MRLIDADAMLARLEKWNTSDSIDKALYNFALHRILEQPTIESEPHMPEIIRCKECKHFHYDMPYVIQGVPVLGHEVCDFWGDGCKTAEDGFCSFAERKVKNERPRND